MRAWVLGSGSSGNAVLLDDGRSRVLIDAGFGTRTMAGRLARTGVSPTAIDACVITHEHHDHAKGAAWAAGKWGWKMFATRGTVRVDPLLAAVNPTLFTAGDTLEIGSISIHTIPVSHDAEEPVSVVATAQSGARIGVVMDLGRATRLVQEACADLDVLILESNHDEEMLEHGPYHPMVKRRIAGAKGHLSNRAAAALARERAHRSLAHLVLAHLSETNNRPDLAVQQMTVTLRRANFGGSVTAARQDMVCGPFAPRRRLIGSSRQLSLGI